MFKTLVLHGLKGATVTSVKLQLKIPPMVFVRIMGENDTVRELKAIIDTGSTHVVIPPSDAVQLGYDLRFNPSEAGGTGEAGVTAITPSTIEEAPLITLREIRIGDLSAKNVKAIAYDLPEVYGAEVLLGMDFLKHFKTTIDYEKGVLIIEG